MLNGNNVPITPNYEQNDRPVGRTGALDMAGCLASCTANPLCLAALWLNTVAERDAVTNVEACYVSKASIWMLPIANADAC